MSVTYIYGLHGGEGVIRYIGKTTMAVADRLRAHRYFAKRGLLPVHVWIRSQPAVYAMTLEVVPEGGDWKEVERFWIALYREQATNILNCKAGGGGGSIRTPEHRAAIAKALRRGSFFPCVRCAEPTWRTPYQVKKNLGRYCGRGCSDFAPRRKRKGMPEAVEAAAIKRRTILRCPSGHPYSGDNLSVRQGRRICKACSRAATAAYRAKIRSKL